MPSFIDMTGQKFGRMLVIARADYLGPHVAWRCLCDCGTEKNVRGHHLRTGYIVSCGCHRNEIASQREWKHGECTKRTVEYNCWANIWRRCSSDAGEKDRKIYADRGITVCERWKSFANFLADMGRRPSPKHSIDRINNDGNYEPGNCRWALLREQSTNKRTNHIVHYHGQRLPFKRAWEASKRIVSYGTAHSRVWRDGWLPEAAIDTPA